MTPRDLYARFVRREPVLLLDVRNADEHARWRVEGPRPPDTLNLPYFDFLEDETGCVGKVLSWIAGREGEVAVLCAKGGSSEWIGEILRARGVRAANVEGGMVAWGRETVFQPVSTRPATWQVNRFGKGCLSYVVASGGGAIVVDPHRDMTDYLSFLRGKGLSLRAVLDTHLHADHVSGGRALAAEVRVPYFGNPADFGPGRLPFEPVGDQALLALAGFEIAPLVVLHTPGHTPGSACLLVNEALLLTGDTLFVGSVGRPDLGGQAAEWARDLHRTLQGRLARLAPGTIVLPSHTSGPAEAGSDGTVTRRLGDLLAGNPLLRLPEEAFVAEALRDRPPAPPHYEKIRAVNLGTAEADTEELTELELGKNECALAR